MGANGTNEATETTALVNGKKEDEENMTKLKAYQP